MPVAITEPTSITTRATASGLLALGDVDSGWDDVTIVSAPVHMHRPAISRTQWPKFVAGVIGSVAIVVVIAQNVGVKASPIDADLANLELPSVHLALAMPETVPPKPARLVRLEDQHPIPVDKKGAVLTEKYPSLLGWIHPVSGADELFPWNPGRHFGATRRGIERSECGGGHCGVDLDGPQGRPLVAVAAAVVVKVERRASGGDGISGRFVRMQHEDNTITTYMHMDEVVAGLEVGDRVSQGQYIGTLGSTAVDVAHLHFSLEIPTRANMRGDISQAFTRYIDPAPFLLRATVARIPERRHAIKPPS